MSRQISATHLNKSKVLDNKYMLGDEIGKGAYGRVYKGLDLENGDFVAIKQVSLENIAQEDLNIIMQEIDLLKNLNHKNIVKYLGSSKTRSHLHIILEYMENGSLANIIKPNKFGPFPESLVAVYISQVLEGLVYLHEQGVIHRDIKGANILTTKEGLVKLADFGVATKLTEADVNTHSVVGTPYWMAPEVIEMSGVCAASDIWSVGCTVIELLTCVPPYYDLQPMPALFRIVQDDCPPIPDGLSPDITDFLTQCFKKDARQRPDAKTLLSHPWIQNSRRAALNPFRRNVSISLQDGVSVEAEVLNTDNQTPVLSLAVKESETAAPGSENDARLTKVDQINQTEKNNSSDNEITEERTNNVNADRHSDEVPTLAIHEKPSALAGSGVSPDKVATTSAPLHGAHGQDQDEVVMNGDAEYHETKKKHADKKDGEKVFSQAGKRSFGFLPRMQDNGVQKAVKAAEISGGNELSKFSDSPRDALLDDLFHRVDKNPENFAAGASTSASHTEQENGVVEEGKTDLATRLRATILQKQMGNDQGHTTKGSDLLRLMIGVLKDDVIDIDGLIFDDKLPAESLFPLQAVEFGRLVGSLRSDESEDVIANACQKLVSIFQHRPEQKIVFISQHGLLPLMELLEVPKTRVICSVLQLINQIIKENTNFQENACLVGMIPVVMSFAGPDRPREIRMESAYFLHQLCLSSPLTLQMFIACRGIPVLVGFLEADYAKYREMVHLAIDGIWQIFKLHRSTPKNDFCRIAAKNGILIRLINTLYSLNEATRLASITVGTGFALDAPLQRHRSGQLDSSHATEEPSHASTSQSHSSDAIKVDAGHLVTNAGKPTNAAFENSVAPSLPNSTTLEQTGITASKEPSTKEGENLDRQKVDPSRAENEVGQQRISFSANRKSTDRLHKLVDSNGIPAIQPSHSEQVRPLLSLLEMEPPSGRLSGQLEYVQHLPGLEKHESILPLLHTSVEKKTNGELDFLMAEFAEVSGRGKENGNADIVPPRIPQRTSSMKLGPVASNDGTASASGIASQTASGVLSGSGVLNARPGSATSSGLLSHMVSTMDSDVAKEYLKKVAYLLLEFSQADTTVKSFMCSQSLLNRLFQMFNRVEPPILLEILTCINNLSTDPNCLENLQRADAIKYLIPNLELKDGPLVNQIHHEVLNALFNLCKINKRRQEQAAENGMIPHLMNIIMSGSPLKQYALPLLCDMAHASRVSREQLRAHDGLDVYLSLLDDVDWSVTALDSIAVCLAHDNANRKVEQALLKRDAVQRLVKFFQCCPEQQFVHILEPFLKIITKSSQINKALATNGLTPLLISRLDHQDAIARLNLLKLIKAVYEHHPRPKQLIVENDLPHKLQNLIEERRDGQSSGGQVLVKQMATSLLKALHINTVL